MKAMPLAFEDFQGKGVLVNFSSYFSSSDSLAPPPQQQQQQYHQLQEQEDILLNKKKKIQACFYVGSSTTEPTSVLETRRSLSPSMSSSTLSSSLGNTTTTTTNGGGGGCGCSATATPAANVTSGNVDIMSGEKCGGLVMEDWGGVLSGPSSHQEQSILRLIMGDIDDPVMGLNRILQSGNGSNQDLDFNAGFGLVDQAAGFGFDHLMSNNSIDPCVHVSDLSVNANARLGPTNLMMPPGVVFPQQAMEGLDEKPQIFNPQLIINPNQAQFAQSPALCLPLQEHNSLLSQPPTKRLNFGPNHVQVPKVQFPDSSQHELFLRRQQQQLQMLQQHQGQAMGVSPPPPTITTTTKQKMVNEELAANEQLQQAIIDQIFKAAELIGMGNPALAQGILARLNHQLSPIGKPFQRAAFYLKEALQLLAHMNASNSTAPLSSYSVIFKVGAYKSFCEISPILQFANFTCNQALLEAFERCERIHIIDFDIGYGGQWASLMQELVLRTEGPPLLKITAFASPSTRDELELTFTQENLKHFASEINMPLELEILNLESLNSASWSLPLCKLENEVLAVNLPVGSFSNCPATVPLVLGFVKQLSPKIIVSLDRGCDRADVPFAHHMIHALHSYSGLLDSLDAVNVNSDVLQKIEKFLIHPSIEKIVLGRHRTPERLPDWRSLFMQSGFSPLTFSNFTESQAECLLQRTPVRGFHVEKRQSSLVLCWQRKDLISASAWRC